MTEIEKREDGPGAGASSAVRALETRILRGSAWFALGFGSRQLITWLSMLVLVRLLDAKAFGLMALSFTILSAVQYLRGSGLWAALVHRRTNIEEAAASALVYYVVSGVAIYAVCFATAPLFAAAFHASELTSVVRVLALIVVSGALCHVPSAILERDLRYSSVAKVDLGSAAAQAATSLPLAFAGAGVWSLVAGQLAVAAYETAALWYLAPWRPSPGQASWSMLRELFHYGRFAGAANFAIFLGGTLDTVAVGRILGATAAGFYSVSFRIATLPESVFSNVIVRAMFPAFSLVRDDREEFRKTFVQHAQRLVLIVLPVAIFVALAARPIVLALLGNEWRTVVTPLRILAIVGFMAALSATAGAVFRGAGRPELAMWFSLANVVLLIPALFLLTRSLELNGAAVAVLACLTAATLPALAVMIRLIGLSAGDLLHTLRPSFVCSGVLTLALVILIPATRTDRPLISLVVLLVGGIGAYLASTALFARSVVVPMWLDLRGTRTQ
jgi:O-antigen/teichoic acid export membrane protein